MRDKLLEKLRELADSGDFIPHGATHVDITDEELSSFEKHTGGSHAFCSSVYHDSGNDYWIEWEYPHGNHDYHLKRLEVGDLLPLDLLSAEELEEFKETKV